MRLKPFQIALALAALLALPLAAAETKEKAAAPPAAQAAPAAGAAMKIHVDPVTGQIVPKPAPGTKTGLTPTSTDTRPPAKVEDVKAKAGGKRVRLGDRFLMEMTASATPDGKVSYSCVEKDANSAASAKEDGHDR